MRKLIIGIILMFAIVVDASSQGHKEPSHEMVQRMKVEKISFLANFLELTPSEAQVFWPVYNEYERKKFNIEKNKKDKELRINGGLESLSEAELKKMCNEFVVAYSDEAQLMVEYNKRFLEVLPARKVLLLYQAERKFRSRMLQEFRHRQTNGEK